MNNQKLNKPLESAVKITEDFFEKIQFTCDKCGSIAELMTPEHTEWLSFCAENGRNPEELQFAFRKKGCETACDGILVLEERGTLQAIEFKGEEEKPTLSNPMNYTVKW